MYDCETAGISFPCDVVSFVEISAIKQLFEAESKRQGKYFDSPHSANKIPSFIKLYHLKTDELLEPDISKYKSFNDFFYRKLKPNARTIADPGNDNIFVSAADCSIAIFRLAPQDYHRFHSPVTGVVGSSKYVNGTYYTVNPMAVNEDLNVFTENVRSMLLLHPSMPGASKVVFIAIGALLVGSIKYTLKEGDQVFKGDELGYFAYGGSTIICLWPKGEIKFDNDLVSNSMASIETLVKVGMRIGVRASVPPSDSE
ncbi:12620_t:CDS:2 [Racocetra fulgida]|uniref:12620_t:CDS:1 n=1 Tax=Racocetra fulgida TaxID=60492 RepID=A0A9N8W3P2_9GLOM|nr:12620_t:CDS:2 [Racocetra fulgida]